MPNSIKRLLRIIDFINKVNGWLLALLLTIMTILIFWQVLARFVIGNSLTFSEEISRFAMIWMTLLGMAYALRNGSLVSIELLPEILSGWKKKLVLNISYMLVIIFSLYLVKYGWDMANAAIIQTSPSTRISMFFPAFSIPAGGFLLIINTIALIIEQYFDRGEIV